MGVCGVVLVARAIEVGRHQDDGIKAVWARRAWQSFMPAIFAIA